VACLQIWKMSKAGLVRRFDPYKIKTNSNFQRLTEQFSLNCLSLPTELITFTTDSPCQCNYLPLPVLAITTHLTLPLLDFVATRLPLPLFLYVTTHLPLPIFLYIATPLLLPLFLYVAARLPLPLLIDVMTCLPLPILLYVATRLLLPLLVFMACYQITLVYPTRSDIVNIKQRIINLVRKCDDNDFDSHAFSLDLQM